MTNPTSPHSAAPVTRRASIGRFVRAALITSLVAGPLWWSCDTGPVERPNIILITMDTTRVDRLSCYGYGRPTTPNLDVLAKDSVVYSRAYAPSSWTLPSHASLFTGKFTTSHGMRRHTEGADWVTFSSLAAWVKLPIRAAASKACRLLSGGSIRVTSWDKPW